MALVPRGGLTVPSENRVFNNAGAPTNGPTGTYAGIAEKGSLLSDTTNAILYMQTGSQSSPTWVTQSNITGVLLGAGAPTNGTTGANIMLKGTFYIDTTAGAVYSNQGTTASPTWTQITIP